MFFGRSVKAAAQFLQLPLHLIKTGQIRLGHSVLRSLQFLGKLLAYLAETALGLLTPGILLLDHSAQLCDGGR